MLEDAFDLRVLLGVTLDDDDDRFRVDGFSISPDEALDLRVRLAVTPERVGVRAVPVPDPDVDLRVRTEAGRSAVPVSPAVPELRVRSLRTRFVPSPPVALATLPGAEPPDLDGGAYASRSWKAVRRSNGRRFKGRGE